MSVRGKQAKPDVAMGCENKGLFLYIKSVVINLQLGVHIICNEKLALHTKRQVIRYLNGWNFQKDSMLKHCDMVSLPKRQSTKGLECTSIGRVHS